jgi:Domain of unknown function (DUF2017)
VEPFVKATGGGYTVELPHEARQVLAMLAGSSIDAISSDTADMRRLIPPAYPDSPERELAYRELVGKDLIDGKVTALSVLRETAHATSLTDAEIEAWMHGLETLRLMIGPAPDDVTVEEALALGDDHGARHAATMDFLTHLQFTVIDALDPDSADDDGEFE